MKPVHISYAAVIGLFTAFLSSKAPAAPPDPSPAAPSEKTFACGDKDKGQPPCPTQKWMKENMAPAAASGDGPALAKALEYVAGKAPAGFTDWASISKNGADKAKAGDIDAAKKSCKACHDKYKDKYKNEVRDRPF
jgi:hypothetical protein